MPYIYTITSDKRLLTNFYGFDQASKDAFKADDKQRIEAILQAQEFRKQLLERLTELRVSEKPRLIDPKIITNNVNDQTLVGRFAALMLDKPDLKSFIKQNHDKLSSEMSSVLKDILQNTQENEYVLFWMLSEDELSEIL